MRAGLNLGGKNRIVEGQNGVQGASDQVFLGKSTDTGWTKLRGMCQMRNDVRAGLCGEVSVLLSLVQIWDG